MGNTQFNELLKSPHLLASMPIEELETITKNYPWFSLAHSYLAKAYQENNSHKTSGQIALASTLHSNRSWLYSFLKEPILKAEAKTELIVPIPEAKQEEIAIEPYELQRSNPTSLAQLAASMLEEGGNTQLREDKKGEEEVNTQVREDKKGEEEENTQLREEKKGEEEENTQVREDKKGEEEENTQLREEKKGEEEVRELDFLDKSILATAVSSSIFLEVSEEDEEGDAMQDSSKDASQGRAEDAAQDSSKGPSEDEESDALYTWLRSVTDAEEIKEDTKEEIREVKQGEEKVRKPNESVQPSIDLIEKFIASEPRITPGKVEQYTGVSFAKDSLEENFEWVTETMAKLYAAQGKIDRARKAYKRLIQLHPEKKIHFENQLKALNQRK